MKFGNFIQKCVGSAKKPVKIVTVVVEVALVFALIPVIKTFISASEDNLSASEIVMAGLITLFIIIGLVLNILKGAGISKK